MFRRILAGSASRKTGPISRSNMSGGTNRGTSILTPRARANSTTTATPSSRRSALSPALIQNSPSLTRFSTTQAMASATTSAGTKSIGQPGSNGISGTVPANMPATTWCRPWNAAVSPVTESPMTTDGRRMTCGMQLDDRVDLGRQLHVGLLGQPEHRLGNVTQHSGHIRPGDRRTMNQAHDVEVTKPWQQGAPDDT